MNTVHTIWVQNLPYYVSNVQLWQLFDRLGQIADVQLRAVRNGGGRQEALVHYWDAKAAEQALWRLDRYLWDRDHRIRLERYEPNENQPGEGYRIAVEGLPISATRQDLIEHMKNHPIVGAKVFHNGHGHVDFQHEADMRMALAVARTPAMANFRSIWGIQSRITLREDFDVTSDRTNRRSNEATSRSPRKKRQSKSHPILPQQEMIDNRNNPMLPQQEMIIDNRTAPTVNQAPQQTTADNAGSAMDVDRANVPSSSEALTIEGIKNERTSLCDRNTNVFGKNRETPQSSTMLMHGDVPVAGEKAITVPTAMEADGIPAAFETNATEIGNEKDFGQPQLSNSNTIAQVVNSDNHQSSINGADVSLFHTNHCPLPFQCAHSKCTYHGARTKWALIMHIDDYHRRLYCECCDFKAHGNHDLNRHMAKQHPQHLTCLSCRQVFNSLIALKRHQRFCVKAHTRKVAHKKSAKRITSKRKRTSIAIAETTTNEIRHQLMTIDDKTKTVNDYHEEDRMHFASTKLPNVVWTFVKKGTDYNDGGQLYWYKCDDCSRIRKRFGLSLSVGSFKVQILTGQLLTYQNGKLATPEQPSKLHFCRNRTDGTMVQNIEDNSVFQLKYAIDTLHRERKEQNQLGSIIPDAVKTMDTNNQALSLKAVKTKAIIPDRPIKTEIVDVSSEPNDISEAPIRMEKAMNSKGKGESLTCAICHKCFAGDGEDELRAHISGQHLGYAPYRCDHCGEEYMAATEEKLLKHYLVKHNQPCQFVKKLVFVDRHEKEKRLEELIQESKKKNNTIRA